jgi:hypothetical protein
MRTHVLRIIAISLLGVCLLCSLAKMGMKNENSKKTCDNACGMLMFVALALIGVSQLNDEEGYEADVPVLKEEKYNCPDQNSSLPPDWKKLCPRYTDVDNAQECVQNQSSCKGRGKPGPRGGTDDCSRHPYLPCWQIYNCGGSGDEGQYFYYNDSTKYNRIPGVVPQCPTPS